MSNFYHWGVPAVDVLKTIPYRESSQIGKRHFVAKLFSVWCGSVSYPWGTVFHFVNVKVKQCNSQREPHLMMVMYSQNM
jgi:hypothetical protein